MKKIGLLLVAGLLAVSSAQCAPATKDTKDAKAAQPASPSMATDFTLQDTRQDTITLSDYRGKKAVLLFFWTTWCPFCQKELGMLKTQYASLAKDGVELLAVDVGEEPDKVIAYVSSSFLPYRVLMDKDTAVAYAYELVGVPSYVLVDKDGKVVFKENFFPHSYNDLLQQRAQ
jgi:peroxiredoxin